MPFSANARALGGAWLSLTRGASQGGVGWSLMLGTGVVLARASDGWSPPSALGLCGFGWGLQAGGALCDVLIVLRNKCALPCRSATQTMVCCHYCFTLFLMLYNLHQVEVPLAGVCRTELTWTQKCA